jgi:hypothetical protein
MLRDFSTTVKETIRSTDYAGANGDPHPMTVTRLAKLTGRSRVTISNIVNGKTKPSIDLYFAILAALVISIQYYPSDEDLS